MSENITIALITFTGTILAALIGLLAALYGKEQSGDSKKFSWILIGFITLITTTVGLCTASAIGIFLVRVVNISIPTVINTPTPIVIVATATSDITDIPTPIVIVVTSPPSKPKPVVATPGQSNPTVVPVESAKSTGWWIKGTNFNPQITHGSAYGVNITHLYVPQSTKFDLGKCKEITLTDGQQEETLKPVEILDCDSYTFPGKNGADGWAQAYYRNDKITAQWFHYRQQ